MLLGHFMPGRQEEAKIPPCCLQLLDCLPHEGTKAPSTSVDPEAQEIRLEPSLLLLSAVTTLDLGSSLPETVNIWVRASRG